MPTLSTFLLLPDNIDVYFLSPEKSVKNKSMIIMLNNLEPNTVNMRKASKRKW